ncbi:MAG: outer membrane protein assembly factor BamA [Deltaproteobacteria bacterium]|nr:outer membrane protein assembly factor BamA [Deltaproteobacteria bacterium]
MLSKMFRLFSLACLVVCLAAPAYGKDLEGPVLVLPFQINASKEMSRLNQELPELVVQRLLARGLPVVPLDDVEDMLKKNNVTELDIASVRALMRRAGALAAIYGVYSQLGQAFSIDARLVYADAQTPTGTFFVEQSANVNLLMAVEELSSRVAAVLLKSSVISQVEVRGTNVLDPNVVLLRINTKQGDVVDPRAIDAEFKRIWDIGFFSDITVELEETDDGLRLVYTVTEKPRVDGVTVSGAHEISQADILSTLTTKVGGILNEKVLASDLQRIQELYRKDGYYLAETTYSIEPRQGGQSAALRFDIKEGNRLYITDVRFEGVESLSQGDVKDELALTERGILSWVTGTGVLKEELIERDVSAIGSYYMNNGFLDVAVGHPDVDYQEDGIVITHKISEGSRYRVNKVSFAGEVLDSNVQMEKVIAMDEVAAKKGFFDLSVMQDDIKKLTAYYAEYGYAFAAVNAFPEKTTDDDDRPMVDLTYNISKKQKVYVRNIVLEGNSHTRDNVILREMLITDGYAFDGAALGRSIRNLNNLGFFELAESELIPTENPEEVDLKIKMQEKDTGSIMVGLGYNTYYAFGVTGTIQEANLWGKGYNVALQALFSGRRTAYDFRFTNPRVNDSLFALGVDLYDWDDDLYDYDKKTIGAGVRVGHPVGRNSYITAGYRMEFYHMSNFDSDASPLITQYAGDRMASIGSLRFSRSTINRMRPSNGTTFILSADYGGGFLSGDDDFVRASAEFGIYGQLRENHLLHARTRVAGLFNNGSDEVPVYQRFWMGGMETIRGYSSRDIVPRDAASGDRLGGNRMAFVNLEYIWSFSPEAGLNLVPFFDAGVNINTDAEYSFSDEIKRSFGLELRWRSPMGDLRFCYGWPLDDGWNGQKLSGRFEFSMGQFF